MKRSYILGIFALIALLSCPTSAQVHRVVGQVIAVADGDTITILDEAKQQYKIRLLGIDASSDPLQHHQRSRARRLSAGWQLPNGPSHEAMRREAIPRVADKYVTGVMCHIGYVTITQRKGSVLVFRRAQLEVTGIRVLTVECRRLYQLR